jgi:hypothetical protein
MPEHHLPRTTVTGGALKHGISEAAVRAVLADPLRRVAQGDRTLLIGVGEGRDLVEVVVESGPSGDRVVHAMRLRPKHYPHLTGEPDDDPHCVTGPPPGAADASSE